MIAPCDPHGCSAMVPAGGGGVFFGGDGGKRVSVISGRWGGLRKFAHGSAKIPSPTHRAKKRRGSGRRRLPEFLPLSCAAVRSVGKPGLVMRASTRSLAKPSSNWTMLTAAYVYLLLRFWC